MIFDSIIGEFRRAAPQATFIVMSDHGHHMRPAKTININEYLRRQGYLVPQGANTSLKNQLRRIALEIANKLDIEHSLIKLLARSKKITQVSKSIYSSSGSIDRKKSTAFLSTFAGIKSYSHAGIEINKELVSDTERSTIASELKEVLLELKTPKGVAQWSASNREMSFVKGIIETRSIQTFYLNFKVTLEWGGSCILTCLAKRMIIT